MIDQLKICTANQTFIELMKLGLIIIKICKKKKRKRDKKKQNNNKREDSSKAGILSVIPLELVKVSSTTFFRVHPSLWVLGQKLGTAQFREILRDLEIPLIRTESLMKISLLVTISDPLALAQSLRIMHLEVCLHSLDSILTISLLISHRISALMVLSTKIY